jgi:protein-ribulosamine 3-kinase
MLEQIPPAVYQRAVQLLQDFAGSLLSVKNFSFTGGGCINYGGRLNTSKGSFFLKWNDEKKFPGMFEAEAKGLKQLGVSIINIPAVIGFGSGGVFQFLLLEFIESKAGGPKYWQRLGRQLAALHQVSSSAFGLDHNNYIGSLKQFNEQQSSWVDFFIEKRLHIQLMLAAERGLASVELTAKFERLYGMLPSLLPEEAPSLLHGDLWAGNLLANEKEEPYLIDPAVYFGCREVDLAMTELFGRFDDEFYRSYDEVFPLQHGYQERVDLYNLYPLLVHVNLFGRSYLSQINSVLDRYVN